jgi:hypothetical protein
MSILRDDRPTAPVPNRGAHQTTGAAGVPPDGDSSAAIPAIEASGH